MRPVVRGNWPVDAGGQPIGFGKYPEARSVLIERLGQYCSYCETRLNASLAVEHVCPKRPPGATVDDPERALDWDNFLLACTNCNSTKSNRNVVLDQYVWPDRDNTFRAFEYTEGGIVREHPKMNDDIRKKARAMIALVGLDRTPNDRRASDRRWLNRMQAWDKAVRAKDRIARCDNEDLRKTVTDLACSTGFWSVWMTVFQDDGEMLRRFVEAFPGTCRDCFDQDDGCRAVRRPGGQC